MNKISQRLLTIAKMVPNSVTADIGSDHGKLMIHLFENGLISYGYAIENKKGPYLNLVKNLKERNLVDKVVPLFSDGLDDLPECVNTIILAGMGGDTIVEILQRHPEKLKNIQTIIVDAHSNIPLVRKEINLMGYVIADEAIVKEADIFYEIIKFVKADVAIYGESDLTYGPILRKEKSALFKEKYQNKIAKIDAILSQKISEQRAVDLIKEKQILESVIR